MNKKFYSQLVQLGGLAALGAFAVGAKPHAPIAPVPAHVAVPKGAMVSIARGAHPLARPENEIGRLDATKHISNLSLAFKPTAQQAADRDALVEAVSNPRSPQYRQFLTTDQYAARFGAKADDIARAEAWLRSQGLEVYPTRSPLGTRVTFGGTVGQLEAAFRAEMHQYKVGGQVHFAMATAPQVPAELADVVMGVHNTHDFYPKAAVRMPTKAAIEAAKAAARTPEVQCPTDETGLGCREDAGGGKVTLFDGIAPPDWRAIYDVNPLYTTGVGGKAITGSGVKLGIVGISAIAEADLDTYWTTYGITGRPAITTTLVPNTGTAGPSPFQPGAGVEAVLDNEQAGAMAPAASINFVITGIDDGNVEDASFYIIENNLTDILSESFGGCEGGIPQSDADLVQVYGSAAALLGITYLASSGDSAATSCLDEGLTGLYVNIPAAYPQITSVGGTGFAMPNGLTFTGTSGTVTHVATGYPAAAGAEQVWLEGNDPSKGVGGGGGGVSVVFSRPSYQTQTSAPTCDMLGTLPVPGITPSAMRQVPDVAFSAAGGSTQFPIFIECSLDFTLGPIDPQNGEPEGDCPPTVGYSKEEFGPLVLGIGGTSASTPAFAGVVALASQAAGGRLGSINPLLYSLPSTVFHDVTSGNNEVLCTSGTDPGCPAGGSYGFPAGKGYDCATGLGSVDANKFVTAIAGLTPTTTTVAAITSPLTAGTPVPVTATVTSTGTTNTAPVRGNVTFTFQSYRANGAPDLTWTLGTGALGDAGVASPASVAASPTFSIPQGMVNSAQGVDVVAEYGGDATHLASVSSKTHVTFAPVSFCPSPSAATVPLGGTTTFTAVGGTAPVKWEIDVDTTAQQLDDGGTNSANLDEKTGVFTAGPSVPGYVIFAAVDSNSSESFGWVTVGSPSADAGAPPWAGDAGFALACAPPVVDAGPTPVTDGSVGTSEDASTVPVGSDGGSSGNPASGPSSSSGCSCTTTGGTTSNLGALGSLAIGLAFVARRKKARRG